MVHTLGPWEASELHVDRGNIQIGTSGDYIGEVYGNFENKEAAANAQLMVNAPEMLEALKELVCCPAFTGEVFMRDCISHRAWTLARAVIIKSTRDLKQKV